MAVVALLLWAAGAQAAPPSSEPVSVVHLSTPARTVVAGSIFRLTDVTRNVGRFKTRPTQVIYVAVRGRKLKPGAVVVARRRVPVLRPGRTSRRTVEARFPARGRTGRYRLMTCAGFARVPTAYDRTRCRIARSFRVLPPSPANAERPSVNGTPTDGQTLKAAIGSWRGLAPISYRTSWQRCDRSGAGCAPVSAAAGATYTLTPADVGSTIRAAVTAQNAFGAKTVASSPTAPVAGVPPSNASPPVISGAAVSGSSVHADPGAWNGTPPISYAYQWQRCDAAGATCSDLGGANTPDYVVPYSDVGPTLRVVLTASGPGGSTTAASPPVPEGLWMNPVYNVSSVPDPFVLDVDGKHADYWAYQTGDRFPVLHSSDLINWTRAGLAMTVRPIWVVQSGDWHPWAPSVIQTTPPCPGSTTAGCFVMYYVGLSAYGVNCVAVATSPKPGGPYTDRGPLDVAPLDVAPPSRPLGCGDDTAAGNIDPSPFVDTDGRAYLYVSSDFAKSGETRTLQPTVSVIPLAPTLVTAASARVPLFAGSPGTWEAAGVAAPTVEGPTMVKHGGIYYLLYSGGSWQGAYGMGYATSTSATGPFTKAGQILAETADVKSPGGGDTPVIGPGGGTWMAYHGRSGSRDQVRMLRLDRFGWSAGSGGPDVPVISGPTSTPQSAQP